jgi:hypothetical protein
MRRSAAARMSYSSLPQALLGVMLLGVSAGGVLRSCMHQGVPDYTLEGRCSRQFCLCMIRLHSNTYGYPGQTFTLNGVCKQLASAVAYNCARPLVVENEAISDARDRRVRRAFWHVRALVQFDVRHTAGLGLRALEAPSAAARLVPPLHMTERAFMDIC